MRDFSMSDFVRGDNAALFTDAYQLTMAEAYQAEGMSAAATFSLFFRELGDRRNYMLSCGIEDVVDFLESVRFSDADIAYLDSLEMFSERFLRYLADFRFTGEVHGMPDGTPVFPHEPLLEVTAPAPQAQTMETWVLNQMHGQCVTASKAARLVQAANGRAVVDFGLRRIHGAEHGVKVARAFHIAGVAATSNMLAGRRYGVPVTGTMAHSYIQAHDDEMDAFRAFAAEFPATILLVDTYDTLAGVDKVIRLAEELGDAFRVKGIRIDSGDLADLASQARERLDKVGLKDLLITVSGGLDEDAIAELLARSDAIDSFGVGTAMGVAADAPSLDMAYKLVEYAGEGRMKLSSGKQTLPGRKQVFRQPGGDILARRDERHSGKALLEPFMKDGRRLRERDTPDAARERAKQAIGELPDSVRAIEKASPGYSVKESDKLLADRDAVRARLEG